MKTESKLYVIKPRTFNWFENLCTSGFGFATCLWDDVQKLR